MISEIRGPFDDEPLFGVLARIYNSLVGPSRSQFAQHIFGRRLVVPFDFPCGIDALARVIGARVGLTVDDLIHRHTMFPIAALLMSSAAAERVKEAMRSDRAVASNLLKWRRDPAEDGIRPLKFCAACRDADLRRTRCTWWRRTHQVPGVICCPIHGTALMVSQFVPGQFWKFDYPLADDAAAVRQTTSPDGIDLLYARDVRWVLRNNPQPIDAERLRILYHQQLDRRGWLRAGQLRRADFLHAFYAQRSEHEWAQRSLLFNPDDSSAWPAQTVKNKANHRSFRMHFLVMRFLDLSVEEIHMQLEKCGTVQPAQPSEAELRATLRERWADRRWTLNAIVKATGIGMTRLLGLALQEGLPVPRFPTDRRARTFATTRAAHRFTVMRGESRVSSRRWQSALKWLRRNDRPWVKANLRTRRANRGDKLDWNAREKDFIARLPQLASRIRAARPFRRVCISSFVSLLPYGASIGVKMRTKMKGLWAEMKRLSESPDDFILRRIRVIRQLHPDLAPYEVRERAAVKRECRDPRILRAMGYELVGRKWQCRVGGSHPLYGLAVATGRGCSGQERHEAAG